MPWIVALAVILPTFMEVLDNSIASVALPYIAGSLGASNDEAALGADQLSGVQRDRTAGQWMVRPAIRAQAVPADLHCHLHGKFLHVRGSHQPGNDPGGAGSSGGGRRRAPAHVAGDSAGNLPGNRPM